MAAVSGDARDTADSVAAHAPRRTAYRTRAEIPAALARSGVAPPAWVKCWLRDLSTTGALVEGSLPITTGEQVRLRFGKPYELISVHATVMRADKEGRVFGMRFDGLDDREARALYALVMELAQEYVKYRARHLAWEPVPDALTPRPR